MFPSILKDLFRIKKLDLSLGIFIGLVSMSIVGSALFYPNPDKLYLNLYESPPSSQFPLGTGNYKDLLAQLISGIKNSFYIGAMAALISLAIGVLVGVISGFKGGIIDSSLMLITDVILVLPAILIMMLIAAYLSVRNPMFVSIVIGVTAWPWVARAVRSQIMSLKTREFMFMSKMAGLRDMIIFEDLLPNMASYLFMAFVLLMSGAMIAEAGLSMIGYGVTAGTTLGSILYWANLQQAVGRGFWWWFVPPGACLVAMTASLLLMSTALDEYFSPRLKGG